MRRDREEQEQQQQQQQEEQQQQQKEFLPTLQQLEQLMIWVPEERRHICCMCDPSFVGIPLREEQKKEVKKYSPKGNVGNSLSGSSKIHAETHQRQFRFDKAYFDKLTKAAADKSKQLQQVEAAKNKNGQPTIQFNIVPKTFFNVSDKEKTLLSLVLQHSPFNIVESPLYRFCRPEIESNHLKDADSVLKGLHSLRDSLRTQVVKKHLRNRVVHLAYDKGTVYKGTIAWVITWDEQAMIWRLTPTDSAGRYEGGVTAKAIAGEIDEIFRELKSFSCTLHDVVSDNAANVLGAGKEAAKNIGILPGFCFAHAAQLCVKDVIAKHADFVAVIEEAKKTRMDTLFATKWEVRLPECNDTRWNSQYRLVKAILDDRKKIVEEGKTNRIPRQFHTADVAKQQKIVDILASASHFTNILQKNGATLLEAVCSMSLLYSPSVANRKDISDATFTRMSKTFDSIPLFFLILFSPLFSIAEFKAKYRAALISKKLNASDDAVHCGVCDLFNLLCVKFDALAIFAAENGFSLGDIKKQVGYKVEEFENNMKKFEDSVAALFDRTVTAVNYRKVLGSEKSFYSTDFGNLKMLLIRFAQFLPSEAVCERVFSILKKIIAPQRSRMDVANAAAVLEIRFLVNNNKWDESDLPCFHQTAQDRVDMLEYEENCVPSQDETPEVCLNSEFVHDYILQHVTTYQLDAESKTAEKCPHCHINFRRNNVETLQCRTCNTRWCYDAEDFHGESNCARIVNKFVNPPEANGNWICRTCRMAGVF